MHFHSFAIISDVPLRIYQRGCFNALAGNIPQDGCYDRNAVSDDTSFLQDVLQQTTSLFENMDAVTFKGERCICSSTYTCGASSGHLLSLTLLTLAIVIPKFVF